MKYRLKRVSEHSPRPGAELDAPAPSVMKFKLKHMIEGSRSVAWPQGPDRPIERSQHETRATDVDRPSITGEQARIAAVAGWAGEDPKRWDKLVTQLKRTWDPTWAGDAPRDLLVAWAGANQRLAEAQAALDRLPRNSSLSPRELATKGGRQADVRFYGRLSRGLLPRAAVALVADPEAVSLIEKLCGIGQADSQP